MVKFSFVEQNLIILWANLTFQGVTYIYYHKKCDFLENIYRKIAKYVKKNSLASN